MEQRPFFLCFNFFNFFLKNLFFLWFWYIGNGGSEEFGFLEIHILLLSLLFHLTTLTYCFIFFLKKKVRRKISLEQ